MKVERILVDVALEWQKNEQRTKQNREKLSLKAKTLIAERRQVRSHGVEQGRTVKQISKELQRELRAWDRLQNRQKITKILEEFKGIQKIGFVRSNEEKQRLTSVTDEYGDIKYDRQEIVDVYASFY